MSSTVFNAHSHAKLAPRERPAGLSLRRRSSDHPMVTYAIIAGIAFALVATAVVWLIAGQTGGLS